MQPSELDMLPYYEYEYTISIYNDIIKERKDNEEENLDTAHNKYNIDSNLQKSMRSAKNMKAPSIKLPNI